MEEKLVPVVEERPTIRKRQRLTGTVRIDKTVRTVRQAVHADLESSEVEVRRVPVDRFVPAPVADRCDGDTLIISVMEEVPVVEKRLKVVEELHITRRRRRRPYDAEIDVATEKAEVTRKPPDDAGRS